MHVHISYQVNIRTHTDCITHIVATKTYLKFLDKLLDIWYILELLVFHWLFIMIATIFMFDHFLLLDNRAYLELYGSKTHFSWHSIPLQLVTIVKLIFWTIHLLSHSQYLQNMQVHASRHNYQFCACLCRYSDNPTSLHSSYTCFTFWNLLYLSPIYMLRPCCLVSGLLCFSDQSISDPSPHMFWNIFDFELKTLN